MAIVSVGVPVYNGENYLAEALDSLLAQSLNDFEIVISDNASTDRTPEICRRYQEKDRRVRYFRNQQNIGAALNFNRVVELSGAPLFHGGACDDLYHPMFLERCVDALHRDPGLILSYARTKMIDETGRTLPFDRERNCYLDSYGDFLMKPVPSFIGESASPERRFRDVLWPMGWSLPLSGVIRTETLLRTSLYRDYYGADKVLLAELALQGRFLQVREELFAKRVHRGGTHYKSTRERAKHESKGPSGMPPQARMLRDYIKMTWAADMRSHQRLHCMVTIVGIARRRDVWRRLLVPGPDNYWGLSFAGQ
jgi:glycosyltransferase involved in cell wall biosynthesis